MPIAVAYANERSPLEVRERALYVSTQDRDAPFLAFIMSTEHDSRPLYKALTCRLTGERFIDGHEAENGNTRSLFGPNYTVTPNGWAIRRNSILRLATQRERVVFGRTFPEARRYLNLTKRCL